MRGCSPPAVAAPSDLRPPSNDGLGLALTLQMVNCDSNAPEDPVELAAVTGGTTLSYEGGRFIYNWKVPRVAGCYMIRMTTEQDGLALTARFKVK